MKKLTLLILVVAVLALISPNAFAFINCGAVCDMPSTQTCFGTCNGQTSNSWTCAAWIQAGCGWCDFQPTPPEEIFLMTLETQAMPIVQAKPVEVEEEVAQ